MKRGILMRLMEMVVGGEVIPYMVMSSSINMSG